MKIDHALKLFEEEKFNKALEIYNSILSGQLSMQKLHVKISFYYFKQCFYKELGS